tara:strand:+ start:190 stop:465 length:276 start_codon:yes stop_codon:yes gene_type:complete
LTEPPSEAIVGLSHINRIQRILLDLGPMTADEIMTNIQQQTSRAPTDKELNNLLSKNKKMFYKNGTTWKKSLIGSSYEVVIWAHVNHDEEE